MPNSLVAKWLVRPLAVAGVGAVGTSGGGLPTTGATTTTTTPAPAPLKPTKLGINLSAPDYWEPIRAFMNLASDQGWRVAPAAGGATDSYFDANRNVIKVLPGDNVYRFIARPTGVYQQKSVDVVCRWDGVGSIRVPAPGIRNLVISANGMRYTHIYQSLNEGWVPVFLNSVDPTNPIRNFDCREANADKNALFDPTYVASVQKFSTLRFMKWQRVEVNAPMTWANRTTPAMGQISGSADGYPIEYMIELANQSKTNPWFCMPWNADADYVRKFAEMVRDKLDPNLKVYVEVANEVWNWGYPVTTQAKNEGLAEGLTTDGQVAVWYRYAEKTIQVMDIWRDVFAGQSSRLVRVAAMQNGWTTTIQKVLQFRDTPQHIDAISSAPYFAYDLSTYTGDGTDLSGLFTTLSGTMDTVVNYAKEFKQVADQYNLRYVTYEAGQHIINIPSNKVDLLWQIQHDPRMGQIYTRFLTRWNNEIGDQMTLFNDIDKNGTSGAWGIFDFVGQAPTATPKAKAVTLFQASISK
jgi:hypothetical protein